MGFSPDYFLHMNWELFYPIITFWMAYIIVLCFTPEVNPITTIKIYYKQVLTALICNIFVTIAAIPCIEYIPQLVTFEYNIFGLFLKYFCGIIVTEIWFYYIHRLLHFPLFYPFHKDHHHFTQSTAYASLYCSMTEMVLLNQLSIAIPFRIFGYNTIEMIIISILVAMNVIKGHATLQLIKPFPSWVPVLWYQNWDHDIHHRLFKYNYGLWTILDRLHGTRHEGDFWDKT